MLWRKEQLLVCHLPVVVLVVVAAAAVMLRKVEGGRNWSKLSLRSEKKRRRRSAEL